MFDGTRSIARSVEGEGGPLALTSIGQELFMDTFIIMDNVVLFRGVKEWIDMKDS